MVHSTNHLKCASTGSSRGKMVLMSLSFHVIHQLFPKSYCWRRSVRKESRLNQNQQLNKQTHVKLMMKKKMFLQNRWKQSRWGRRQWISTCFGNMKLDLLMENYHWRESQSKCLISIGSLTTTTLPSSLLSWPTMLVIRPLPWDQSKYSLN